MKFFSTIKKFLNEGRDSDYNGFSADGEVLTVSIRKGRNNNIMTMSINGERSLSKIKSVEDIKSEYRKEDHEKIEKYWENISKKYAIKLEKLVHEFEKELNNIVIDVEKDSNKL